jgi:hypothetical protein
MRFFQQPASVSACPQIPIGSILREVSVELTPVERINQAFLQLEFAVKLMCYFELKQVDKRTFDTATHVHLDSGSLNFSDNSFKTYDDLILAAQNNYQIALGFSAIVLESGLQDAGLNNNPTDVSPQGQLRTLVYMIRNAFAHDMMMPRWRVDERYRRLFDLQLPTLPLQVDLSELDGRSFDDQAIGGISRYFEIKDGVLRLIAEAKKGAS